MTTAECVQRAIDYIEDHLEEPLELEKIAEVAAMSLPNLYRIFYALTGHPIKEYIRKRRISEGALLLRQSNMPATDIGFSCGFDTYQTFQKTFKRTVNMSPGQYRQTAIIYSFEQVDLRERVVYQEEKEVSERHPNIRVVRLPPQSGIGYLHTAEHEEGLEKEALLRFRALLEEEGLVAKRSRLFGWNIDLPGTDKPCGYQVFSVNPDEEFIGTGYLSPVHLPGGLYATILVPAGEDTTIVAAWNQLLSEWLPQSTFELGDHGYLEEYQQFGSLGLVARLKLYLPVRRRQATETIEVQERMAKTAIHFTGKGSNGAAIADQASIAWLESRGLADTNRFQVYMSSSYGMSPGENEVHSIYLAPPDDFLSSFEVEANRMTRLEGGLYACVKSAPYGAMSGVLERIYRWLAASPYYKPDEERVWYVAYEIKDYPNKDSEYSVDALCCVPILARYP